MGSLSSEDGPHAHHLQATSEPTDALQSFRAGPTGQEPWPKSAETAAGVVTALGCGSCGTGGVLGLVWATEQGAVIRGLWLCLHTRLPSSFFSLTLEGTPEEAFGQWLCS